MRFWIGLRNGLLISMCMWLVAGVALAKTYEVVVDDKIALMAEKQRPAMEEYLKAQVVNEADKQIDVEERKVEKKKTREERIEALKVR